jgi:transposase
MLTPTVRRTLAPRGQTPIHHCWDRRDRISAVSAITLSPLRKRRGLYFALLPDNENVHAEEVVSFLRQLKRHLPGNITIVWDRGRVHDRSRVVQAYLAKHPEIITEKLPAYAPELNPDEQVWSNIKYGRLPNYAPNDIRELRHRLTRELQRLGERSDLLASFINHAKIPLRV